MPPDTYAAIAAAATDARFAASTSVTVSASAITDLTMLAPLSISHDAPFRKPRNLWPTLFLSEPADFLFELPDVALNRLQRRCIRGIPRVTLLGVKYSFLGLAFPSLRTQQLEALKAFGVFHDLIFQIAEHARSFNINKVLQAFFNCCCFA